MEYLYSCCDHDGRVSVQSAVRELVEFGYLYKQTVRCAKTGRITDCGYIAFDDPSENKAHDALKPVEQVTRQAGFLSDGESTAIKEIGVEKKEPINIAAPDGADFGAIEAKADQAAKPATKPKGPLQLRSERLFRRRIETPLSRSEQIALRTARPCIEATSEPDWLALERFYSASPTDAPYRRKDFATLLNNWNGEIEKAHAWCKERKIALDGQQAPVAKPEDVAPDGWREYLVAKYPNHGFEQRQWMSIDRVNRREFVKEILAAKHTK